MKKVTKAMLHIYSPIAPAAIERRHLRMDLFKIGLI